MARRTRGCYLHEPCGHCRWCRAGDHALCPDAGRVGRSRDGGLAEYVVLRADNVFRFDGLSFAAAAVATDAVATPWPGAPGPPRAPQWRAGPDRRRRRPRTQRGAGRPQRRSCGCGRRPRRHAREKARAIGAEVAVAPDEVASVVAWSDGGADLRLEASGRPCGFDSLAASRSFRRQDRLLRVCIRLVVAARLDAPRALGARGDRITGELT
ncbi:MAG: hypothetical protein E6G08_20920 [Actinobacteria bacterium]|nr:MAG: hypothetical protein E6G08_20920 [Actinomycetota bacterium]